MKSVTVTYKCGHEEELHLVGKFRSPDEKRLITDFATQQCSKCPGNPTGIEVEKER